MLAHERTRGLDVRIREEDYRRHEGSDTRALRDVQLTLTRPFNEALA